MSIRNRRLISIATHVMSLIVVALLFSMFNQVLAAKTYVYTAITQQQYGDELGGTDPVTAGSLIWQCGGYRCEISGPWAAPAVGACRALAQRVGPIISYGRSGNQLSARDLAACNEGIIRPAPTAETTTESTVSVDGSIVDRAATLTTARPDLTIPKIGTVGEPTRRSDGSTSVSLKMLVHNAGSNSARPAKVAVFATPSNGSQERLVPYQVRGQSDQTQPSTRLLPEGATQKLDGTVVLPPFFHRERVHLHAYVDSAAGLEFRDDQGLIPEENERNNQSRTIVLAVPGKNASISEIDISSVVGDAAESSAPPSKQRPSVSVVPRASRPEGWGMTLNRLLMWQAAESSGDDPQLFPIVFRARFGDRDSVRTYAKAHPIKPGTDLHNGSIVSIDRLTYRFKYVRRITQYEFDNGALPEVIGIVVVAFEDNGTPDGVLRDFISRARTVLARELQGLIGDWQILHGPGAMQRSLERLTARLEPTIGEVISIVVESGFDPDLPVAVQVRTFVTIDPDDPPAMVTRGLRGTPTRVLESDILSWSERPQDPVDLKAEGRHWKLEMRVHPYSFAGPGDL